MAKDQFTIDAGDLRQIISLQLATVGAPGTRGKPAILWPDSITSATWAGGVATIIVQGTLPAAFTPGVSVGIDGLLPPAWNGLYTVASVTPPSTFTAAIASNPGFTTNVIPGTIQCDPAPGTPIRCKVETLAGRKLEVARQLVSTATHLITVRFRDFDTDLNRLVYKFGRIFNVGWKNDELEMHVKLELTCTEKTPEP